MDNCLCATIKQKCRVGIPEKGIPCELLGAFSFRCWDEVQFLYSLWRLKKPPEALRFFLVAQKEGTSQAIKYRADSMAK